MVGRPGGSPDPRRIRRLKSPGAIEVEASPEGAPVRLRLHGRWQGACLARRPWRIDQHWWRSAPVSRIYYRVSPEDGPALTVYHDLIAGTWGRQEY